KNDKMEESYARILKLKPAWVARNFIPPGKRFNLPVEQYNLGDRGGICERWLASTTNADNKISVPNEGLSFIQNEENLDITLKDAIESTGNLIMGDDYYKKHKTLGRLAKIFDYADRLPYHIHQMQKHASLIGRNSKDEAYYFPEGVDKGKHPETFFGVHPSIVKNKEYDLLLKPLVEWKDDSILEYAFAYHQMSGDGFHIPSGVTHAPGSALTIELQEDSDVFSMMQAVVGETRISKDLLWKDVRIEDKEKYGEKIILEMIDWNTSGDPEFYKNRHTPPKVIKETVQGNSKEYWVFYNTNKFSGKKLYIKPKQKFMSKDNGVYNILVWKGEGKFGGIDVEGGKSAKDELLISFDAAKKGIEIINTGRNDLEIFKFFGPDINPNVPFIS
ncbi:MAG: hypothetical protein ABI550_05785, partial [Ignavibacteriaceae bacterium]